MGLEKKLLFLDKMLVMSILLYLFFVCGFVECVCCVLVAKQLVRVGCDMEYG